MNFFVRLWRRNHLAGKMSVAKADVAAPLLLLFVLPFLFSHSPGDTRKQSAHVNLKSETFALLTEFRRALGPIDSTLMAAELASAFDIETKRPIPQAFAVDISQLK